MTATERRHRDGKLAADRARGMTWPELADRHGVPFYVAAPVSTIDAATPDGAAIPIEERDPREVVPGGAAFNPAFDVTPAHLVTALVTDRGTARPVTPESVAALLA